MSRFVPFVILAAIFSAAIFIQDPPIAAQGSFESQVVALVNQERAALGRSALGTDVRLFSAAEGHADWMCSNQILSHYGAGGSSLGTRATAAGYPWYAVGETIAQGFTSPAAVVAGFKGSPSHWTILMSTSYRDIGAGYVACDGRSRRHYWVLDIANSRSPATPVGGGGGGNVPSTVTPQPAVRTPTPQPAVLTATPQPAVRTPTSQAQPTVRTPTSQAQPTVTRTPPPASVGGAVSGVVRLQGSVPLAGTTILVDGAARATTSSNGAFTVAGLSGGTHTVTAKHPGMLGSARTVSIAGGTLQIGVTTLRAGDLNGDDTVQYDDFSDLFARWGRCAGEPAYLALADFDTDGCNGYGDYVIMYRNYRLVGPTAWR